MDKDEYKDKMFEIADAVTMQDVLNHYGFYVRRARGRIPCPFHNGKDDNLGYSETSFSCFVCGAKGNTISFVAKLFNESNSKAAQRIDQDFNLGLYGRTLTFVEARALERKRQARIQLLEEHKKKSNSYISVCDALHRLDRFTKEYVLEQAKGQDPQPDDFLETAAVLRCQLEARAEDLWEELKHKYG